MLIHDLRLDGKSPAIAENQWDVDATTPISHIVGWTAQVARANGGLKRLIIMAHGNAGIIQLGAEGLTHYTVNTFEALKDQVRCIVLYSCLVANTPPGARMTYGDGGLLISRLAVYTKAYVIASSNSQIYHFGVSSPINFGTWEGDVYLFGPNGNKRLIDWGWIPDVDTVQ